MNYSEVLYFTNMHIEIYTEIWNIKKYRDKNEVNKNLKTVLKRILETIFTSSFLVRTVYIKSHLVFLIVIK